MVGSAWPSIVSPSLRSLLDRQPGPVFAEFVLWAGHRLIGSTQNLGGARLSGAVKRTCRGFIQEMRWRCNDALGLLGEAGPEDGHVCPSQAAMADRGVLLSLIRSKTVSLLKGATRLAAVVPAPLALGDRASTVGRTAGIAAVAFSARIVYIGRLDKRAPQSQGLGCDHGKCGSGLARPRRTNSNLASAVTTTPHLAADPLSTAAWKTPTTYELWPSKCPRWKPKCKAVQRDHRLCLPGLPFSTKQARPPLSLLGGMEDGEAVARCCLCGCPRVCRACTSPILLENCIARVYGRA